MSTKKVKRGGASLKPGGMPLHRQLFLVLRDQILRGTYLPGESLPTEQVLEQEYGVSRITVRRSLSDLADEGFVERQHGRGTFVLEGRDRSPKTSASFMDELRRAELETNAVTEECERRNPPTHVRVELGLGTVEMALYIVRVRRDRATREPLMVTEAWIVDPYASKITQSSLTRRSLFRLMADAGVKIGSIRQELTAVLADPNFARLLSVDIGSPLIRINRLVFDVDGKPVELHSQYLTPERSRIISEFSSDVIDAVSVGIVVHDVRSTQRT
jgi:GntR family transcriptional regulator